MPRKRIVIGRTHDGRPVYADDPRCSRCKSKNIGVVAMCGGKVLGTGNYVMACSDCGEQSEYCSPVSLFAPSPEPGHRHSLRCISTASGELICHRNKPRRGPHRHRDEIVSPGGSRPGFIDPSIHAPGDPGHDTTGVPITNRKVTIYVGGEYTTAPHKIETAKLAVQVGKYAQYGQAIGIFYVPLGKRNLRVHIESYNPYCVILDGWGHPSGPSMMGPASAHETPYGSAAVSRSRYLAHDPRYETDFDAFLDGYIARSGARVLADFRHTKGYSSY
jgi:hypothetical protein